MESIEIFLATQRSLLAEEKAKLTASRISSDNFESNNSEHLILNSPYLLNNYAPNLPNSTDDNYFTNGSHISSMESTNSSADRDDSSQLALNFSNNNIVNPFQLYDQLIQNEFKTYENNPTELPTIKNHKQLDDKPVIVPNNKHDMDSWITDKFYDYFPSFGDNRFRREQLSRARRKEYNDYLKKVAEHEHKIKQINNFSKNKELQKNAQTNEATKSTTTISEQNIVIKANNKNNSENGKFNNSRNKLIEDLKHTDLPSIFYSNAAQVRNDRATQDKYLQKMEYQKELIKQIEEKKREMEMLRAKEKEEEERLTRKLEEQLKTMQLEEKLSNEKAKNDRARIINEQNHVYRMHLLAQLENDPKIYNSDNERKAQSENGKDQLIVTAQKPYNHFTNSAPTKEEQQTIAAERNVGIEFYNVSQDSSQNNAASDCQRYPRNHYHIHHRPQHQYKPIVFCEWCERKQRHIQDLGRGQHCIRCNGDLHTSIPQRNELCSLCDKINNNVNRKNDHFYGDYNMSFYCSRCQHRKRPPMTVVDKPTIQEEVSSDDETTTTADEETTKKENKNYKVIRRFQSVEHDLKVNPVIIRNDNKPYSMNVPVQSSFNRRSNENDDNPERIRNDYILANENFDEIRRKTDAQIAKYAKNYGGLRNKPSKLSNDYHKSNKDNNHDDSFPIPLLKYNSIIKHQQHPIESTKDECAVSPAVKMLDSKWTV